MVPCFRKSGRSAPVRCESIRWLDRWCLAPGSPVAQRQCGANPFGGSTGGALLPEVRSLYVRAFCHRQSALKRADPVFRSRSSLVLPPFLLASAVRVPRLVHLEKSLSRNGPNAQNRPPQIQTESKITRLNPDRSNQFIIARHAVNVICAIQRSFSGFPCFSYRFAQKERGFPAKQTGF